MSFNLFGPATICDIKVGYISTDRGYVEGVSRYEANQYAALNPGTQFIFKNRDLIRYLNINEVNALTPEDLLPNRIPTNGCDQESVNTFGLDIYNPDGSLKQDATGTPGSPRVYINGGGGVGANANAVIGNDGSLLGVDVVDGGYGYRFPPQIDIVDLEGLGSGAVAIASLCPPDKVGTLQTFENEEDFEEYDFRNCAPAQVSFGRRQGANGEDIGEWDPTLYASLKVDPIRREIIAYQEFLDSIGDGWWDTRKAKPIEIIADDKKGNVKYDVQHWAWGGSREVKKIPSKKKNFQEIEFKVYTQGGNQRDRNLMFTFVEKNGNHRFKIKAASFQDAKVSKVKIKLKPNAVYTVTASGRHKGKGVEQGLIESFGRKPKERNGRFTDGTRIFADFVKSANDNDDLQIEATQGKFKTDNRRKINGHSTFDLTYQVVDTGQFKAEEKTKVVKKIEDSFMNRFAISPVPPSNVRGSDFAGIQYSFIYEENFPYDGEYVFKAMADNVGEVYVDNESILQFRRFKGGPDVVKKFIKAGVHKIRCDLFNIPQKVKVKPKPGSPAAGGCPTEIDFKVTTDAGFANGISIPDLNINLSKERRGKQLKESFRRTVELGKEYDVICTSNSQGGGRRNKEYKIEVADRGSLGRGDRAAVKDVSDKKIKFTDSTSQMDTDAEFKILSTSPGVSAKFSGSNDRDLKLIVSGKGDVTLQLKWDDDPNRNGEAVGNIKVAGEVWKQRAFKDKKGDVTKTIKVSGSDGGRNKANIRLRTAGANVLQMEDHKDNDWSDLVCTVSCGRFIKINGNRCKLIFDAPKKQTGKSTVSTGEKPTEIFNTLDYINKADRKLYRINPNAGRDSNFLNRFGVLPFNPAAVEREEVLVPVKSPPQPKPRATIERDGDKLFLKVTGGGRVKVDFRLKVDDNLYTSGVFAKEIVIKTDDNDLKLQRDIRELQTRSRSGSTSSFLSGKKKETITGSGTFTGGKTYRIKVIGGSPTSGFKPIDKTTVGFDDDIKNGYDRNGLLRITNVKILQESDSRYETKQNQVTKVVKRFPQKPNASTDSYAGIHVIRWEHVEFPVDGNYNITTMVDDNAKIFIGNRDGNGKKAIGNGLRSVEKGGDEVIIEKRGFAQGSSTGKSVDTRFFKKGKYRIRVELEQIPGKPLAKGNPMAFAMKIKSPGAEEIEVISARSWNENPMGVALKIDPPLPPIPQEPVPRAPGRCPNNPIWSTRFPGGQKSWWPVTHANQDGSKTWSKFMNRFATSPIPPLSSKGSAQGGIVFSNSWNVEIPYDGFYGMKGTVDNGGRILVDGKVILQGGYFPEAQFRGPDRTLEGFGSETPQTVKFPLTQGNHTITVEVENRAQTVEKKLGKKIIFSTADWGTPSSPKAQSVKVDFKVTTAAKFANSIKFGSGAGAEGFSFGKSYGGPQINGSTSKVLETGKVYEVTFNSNRSGGADSGVRVYNVTTSGASRTSGRRVVSKGREIQFDDDAGNGFDENASLRIQSSSPGVTAKFSNDGSQLIVNGKGSVNLRFKWDDKPNVSGLSVGTLKVGSATFRQKGTEGSDSKTIKVDTAGRGSGGNNKSNIRLRNAGATVVQMEEHNDNDWQDLVVVSSKGRFFDLNGNKAKFVVDTPVAQQTTKTQGGVTYSGPELFRHTNKAWSKYMNKKSVSPFIPPLNEPNQKLVGTKIFTWSNVNFFENGRYEIKLQSDGNSRLFINGQYIMNSTDFSSGSVISQFVNLSAGNYEVKVEALDDSGAGIIFNQNPRGFALEIKKEVIATVPAQKSWRDNPVGISAILIPPPCPLETKGLGKLCDIFPLNPGNGYSAPPGPGYPVVLEVIRLEPVNPGINYGPDDAVCIIKEDGSRVCFPPNLGPFGANLPIDVDILTPGGGAGVPVTSYPNIFQSSPTGVNSRFRPVIRVRRDPLDVEPEDILQVTDLVGLKRTGYVGGREYFGAVFYKNGIRYAGYYETPGQLIQVYDTLQESIDGEVTTRPSAILRQGTDITSNDPRLNIPGTPENLT